MGGVTGLLPFFLRKALMTKAETTDIDYKQRTYEETLAEQEHATTTDNDLLVYVTDHWENRTISDSSLPLETVRTLPRGV